MPRRRAGIFYILVGILCTHRIPQFLFTSVYGRTHPHRKDYEHDNYAHRHLPARLFYMRLKAVVVHCLMAAK